MTLIAPVSIAVGLVFLPGLLAGKVGRLGWRSVLLVSPALSVLLIAVSSLIAPTLNLGWGWPVVALALLGSLVLGAGMRLLGLRFCIPKWSGEPLWFVVGFLIAGSVHAFRLLRALGRFDAFSQTYDATFHLNNVHHILTTGNGSPFHMTVFGAGDSSQTYPAGWHDLAALIAGISGSSIPVAVNTLTIVITAVLWPLGVGLLLATCTRSYSWGGLGALFSACLAQMPNLLTTWGVLYPTLLSLAMVPSVLALLYLFTSRKSSVNAKVIPWLGFCCIGLALVHPGTLLGVVFLGAPIFCLGLVNIGGEKAAIRGTSRLRGQIAAGVFAVTMCVLMVVGIVLTSGRGDGTLRDDPIGSTSGAVRRILTLTMGVDGQVGVRMGIVLILFILGFIVALYRREVRWFPVSFMVGALLYLVSYSSNGTIARFLVGMWNGDSYRLAALSAVASVPILALGVGVIAQSIERHVNWRRLRKPLACGVAGALFILIQSGGMVDESYRAVSRAYALDPNRGGGQGLISGDELDILERLDQFVPPNGVVAGSPWTGTVFAPTLGGRDVLFGAMAGPGDLDRQYIAGSLNRALEDPGICVVLERHNVTHVLDFGHDYLWGGNDRYSRYQDYPGLEKVTESGVGKVVDQQGNARLIEITACN